MELTAHGRGIDARYHRQQSGVRHRQESDGSWNCVREPSRWFVRKNVLFLFFSTSSKSFNNKQKRYGESVALFKNDVHLVFSNAMLYNKPVTSVYKMAVKVKEHFDDRIVKLEQRLARSAMKKKQQMASNVGRRLGCAKAMVFLVFSSLVCSGCRSGIGEAAFGFVGGTS